MKVLPTAVLGTALTLGLAAAGHAQDPVPGSTKAVGVDLGTRTVQSGRIQSLVHDYRTDTYEWAPVGTKSVQEMLPTQVWVPDVDVVAVYVTDIKEYFGVNIGNDAATWLYRGGMVSQSGGSRVEYFAASGDSGPQSTSLDAGSANQLWNETGSKTVWAWGAGMPDAYQAGQPIPATLPLVSVGSESGSTGLGSDLGSSLGADYNVVGTVDETSYNYVGVDPIVLDIGHRQRPDLLSGSTWAPTPGRPVDLSALRPFDLDGSGSSKWEWIGPGSGLLVWDPSHTGRITSGKQLIGTFTWGKYWTDGYQVLQYLDRDHDGRLSGAELKDLAVWVDANSDGVAEPGEVKPLSAWGITSISTRPQQGQADAPWNPRGFVQRTAHGLQAHATWDWTSFGMANDLGNDSTYVWVATSGGRKMGGVLDLRSRGGRIGGFSMPTFGPGASGKKIGAVWPIDGSQTGRALATWQTPTPIGSSAESLVTLADGGRHLFGTTTLKGPGKPWSYDWQAELIKGAPLR